MNRPFSLSRSDRSISEIMQELADEMAVADLDGWTEWCEIRGVKWLNVGKDYGENQTYVTRAYIYLQFRKMLVVNDKKPSLVRIVDAPKPSQVRERR